MDEFNHRYFQNEPQIRSDDHQGNYRDGQNGRNVNKFLPTATGTIPGSESFTYYSTEWPIPPVPENYGIYYADERAKRQNSFGCNIQQTQKKNLYDKISGGRDYNQTRHKLSPAGHLHRHKLFNRRYHGKQDFLHRRSRHIHLHLSRNYTKKDHALVSTPITLSEDDDDFEHGNGSSDRERDDFQMVVSELEESPNAAEKNAGICRNRNGSFRFLKERRQTHTERDRAHHRLSVKRPSQTQNKLITSPPTNSQSSGGDMNMDEDVLIVDLDASITRQHGSSSAGGWSSTAADERSEGDFGISDSEIYRHGHGRQCINGTGMRIEIQRQLQHRARAYRWPSLTDEESDERTTTTTDNCWSSLVSSTNGLNTLSSTSSLSNHQKHCQFGRMSAKFKFSSLSTIYPDDSPLLLDHVDDDDLPSLPSLPPHLSQNGGREGQARRKERNQQRRVKKFSRQNSTAGERPIVCDDEAVATRREKAIELTAKNCNKTTKCSSFSHICRLEQDIADFCAPTPTLEQFEFEIEEAKQSSTQVPEKHEQNGEQHFLSKATFPANGKTIASQTAEIAPKEEVYYYPPLTDWEDLPPTIQPLQLWRPLQTSTRKNILTLEDPSSKSAVPNRLSKTNLIRISQPSTKNSNSNGSNDHSAILAEQQYFSPLHFQHRLHFITDDQQQQQQETNDIDRIEPKSLFDPNYQDAITLAKEALFVRPERFKLPSALAKSYGIKGILFLTLTVVDWKVGLHIHNAAFFSTNRPPISSCVKAEIRKSESSRHRKRTKQEQRQRQLYRCAYRTAVVPANNQPFYDEEFKFKVSRTHLKNGDKLCLTVYETATKTDAGFDFSPRKVFGRMSFSLRKFFRIAYSAAFPDFLYHDLIVDEDNGEPITVCQGGYFLLPESTGLKSHLSQNNVSHRKYYDEIGGSTISSNTCSSSFRGIQPPSATSATTGSATTGDDLSLNAHFGMPTMALSSLPPSPFKRMIVTTTPTTAAAATATAPSATEHWLLTAIDEKQKRRQNFFATNAQNSFFTNENAHFNFNSRQCLKPFAASARDDLPIGSTHCCKKPSELLPRGTKYFQRQQTIETSQLTNKGHTFSKDGVEIIQNNGNTFTGNGNPFALRESKLDNTKLAGVLANKRDVGNRAALLDYGNHFDYTTSTDSYSSLSSADVNHKQLHSVSATTTETNSSCAAVASARLTPLSVTPFTNTTENTTEETISSNLLTPPIGVADGDFRSREASSISDGSSSDFSLASGFSAPPTTTNFSTLADDGHNEDDSVADDLKKAKKFDDFSGTNLYGQKSETSIYAKDNEKNVQRHSLRRVSSFTSLPSLTTTANNHKKKADAIIGGAFSRSTEQQQHHQTGTVAHVAAAAVSAVQQAKASAKFKLGPIGKTMKKMLGHKKDPIFQFQAPGAKENFPRPTRNECDQWSHSFSALLNHKYGCAIFRQFVATEHSEENLDFWQLCEEFKRLKRGGEDAKAAEKARQIFDLHLSTTADKEVNLDSRTKCATKAFLEAAGLFADECFAMAAVGECLDMGVFNLAQAKIEQLMEKDSYQRFLKSDTFLEIVQHANKDGGKSTGNGGKHFRLGVRQSTSPTPTTSNRPNDANDRQLRS